MPVWRRDLLTQGRLKNSLTPQQVVDDIELLNTTVNNITIGAVGWGDIQGNIVNQVDLQTQFSTKSNTGHGHSIGDIATLSTELSNKEPANVNIQAHISSAHAPSNAQKNSDILKSEIETVLTGIISSHSHAGGGGLGYAIQFDCPNQATTTDAQTVFWGSKNLAQQTTADIHRIYIPKAGTIKACYIHSHSATAGTGENWSMNIRLNNTSDTLVQTLALANAHRVWSNTGLNIAVVAGNYIEIKEIQPTWATNPANVRRSGIIYIE